MTQLDSISKSNHLGREEIDGLGPKIAADQSRGCLRLLLSRCSKNRCLHGREQYRLNHLRLLRDQLSNVLQTETCLSIGLIVQGFQV
jgi:hypothetical protein